MVDKMIQKASMRLDSSRSLQSSQSGEHANFELQQKLEFLEMQNNELENEIDTSKAKARGLLMQKEL